MPVLWWRSVGHSHNGFAVEAFFDELAHAGGKDPFELRRTLLANQPRMRAVLELVAQKANWGKQCPAGRGRGIATHFSFDSYVAQVAEVSVDKAGEVRVHRVVCAVDCGRVVNPDTVKAQMEGGNQFRLDGGAQRRDHVRSRARTAAKLSRLPNAAHKRVAGDRSLHRAEYGNTYRRR